MTRFLLLFLMLGPACLITAVSKQKRTEEVLAPACIAVILVLYFFYTVNQLLIGFYAAIALLLGCWAAGLWLHLRRISKEKLARFLTPGAAVFFVAMIVIWLITRRSQTRLWDELRLWSGVPKILFYTNQLQLGPDCFTYFEMQSYYPGIILFQYFFQRLGSAFNENGLFFAYAFLGLTLMIPCCRNLRWNKGWWIPVLAFLLVLLPCTFANGMGDMNVYYYSIYIDGLLGIAFAYSLFCIWQMRCRQGSFEKTAYVLSLCLLTLLKDSGLLLVVLSMVICLILCRKQKGILPLLLIAAAAVAVVAGIWKILLHVHNVYNHIGFRDSPLRILTEGTLSDRQLNAIDTFFNTYLLRKDLTGTRYPSLWLPTPFRRTWVYFTLFFAGWSLLLWLLFRRKGQPVGGLLIGLMVSNVVYQISLLVLYICAMPHVPSYVRYSSTLNQAMMNLLSMLSLELLITHPVSQRVKAAFATIGLIIALSCSYEFPYMSYAPAEDPVNSGMHHVAQITWQLPERTDDETIDLFVVQDSMPGVNHHQIYFRLIEDNIRVKSYFPEVRPERDYPDAQAWMEHLLAEDYDYVYLESFTPSFEKKMSPLFGGEAPESYRLYTVTPEGLVKTSPSFTPTPFMGEQQEEE
ncbi:MAG: hypothetical protein E7323_06010 [Clostridiales bacterium]|nr:hypothetical protein [Clostridiales bacterium]